MAKQTLSSTGGPRLIGRTKHGSRVFVEIKISEVTVEPDHNPQITVDHREIRKYATLSMSGCEVEKGERNAGSWGQIDMDLGARDFETTGVGTGNLIDIFDLWERLHLNDMQAGCVHQEGVSGKADYDEWRRLADEQTSKCPHEYRYGSKWLVKEIPDEDRAKIFNLIERLKDEPMYAGE